MANELQIVEEFIFTALSGDTTLKNMLGKGIDSIFPYVDFEGAPGEPDEYPTVVYGVRPLKDEKRNGGITIFAYGEFYVTIYGYKGASQDSLAPIVTRVYTLLDQKFYVTTSTGKIIQSARTDIAPAPDVQYGEVYPGVEQTFSVMAQAS